LLFTKKPYLIQVAAAVTIFAFIFGIRQSVPMFFSSINNHTGLGIVAVSLAFACGQLAWGAFQPFAGAISDKYGTEKALLIGIAMCVTGTLLIPYATTQFELIMTIGILSAGGAGFAGNSVLMSAVNRFVPPGTGGLYAGLVNAGGSIGQFIMAPIAGWLIVHAGWENGLTYLALFCLMTVPLSLLLRGKKSSPIVDPSSPPPLNLQQSIALAFRTPSYLMLNAGFFVCGFHVAFIATHMPGVIDLCGLPPTFTGWALATIGLFNIVGSLAAGWLTTKMPMKHLLSYVYAARGVIVILFILGPKTELTVLLFAATLGLTYLSTVPPTAGLVAKMFGRSFMGTLFGIVLFTHQIGGFLGAYLGGQVFQTFGNYNIVWYIDIMLAVFAALIHLPIQEKPVQVATPQAAS
jgi:MFS family permease